MKRLLLVSLFLPLCSFGQDEFIVFFKDKSETSVVELSERSISRRRTNKVVVDETDYEINHNYIDLLSQDGNIHGQSRWLNAVSFQTNLTEDELLHKYTFVKRVVPVIKGQPHQRKDEINFTNSKTLNYNVADTQIRQIGIDCLHSSGNTGEGVYFAVIDAGFSGMDTISYFDSTFMNNRILDQFDFVNGTGVFDYSAHGTAVSSCVFGYMQNGNEYDYLGGAPHVDVALYVSEDVSSESLIEEFNLVQALERCDQQGVQVVNISLGYTEFDNPSDNHSYAELDGNTTMAAQGVNLAVSKGMIVVVAAGNSGPQTISTPCDADSSLCAGAVNNQGQYAPFSSLGPNSDNQVKPDVVATGWNTWVIDDAGNLLTANGTSFASPMLAGAVACLIQAHPTLPVSSIIDAVRQSASQFSTPDEYIGFGIANFCQADQVLTNQTLGISASDELEIYLYPNPTSDLLYLSSGWNESEIIIRDLDGRIVKMVSEAHDLQAVDISILAPGLYIIQHENRNLQFLKK